MTSVNGLRIFAKPGMIARALSAIERQVVKEGVPDNLMKRKRYEKPWKARVQTLKDTRRHMYFKPIRTKTAEIMQMHEARSVNIVSNAIAGMKAASGVSGAASPGSAASRAPAASADGAQKSS